MRLIRNINRTPTKAASLKMAHFNNVGVIEVFLEATPTTFITTILLMLAFNDKRLYNFLIASDLQSFIIFCVGYAASILSSAFGVSK